jgi:hypothetical protein
MERKIVLEVEELEERIAPHLWLGADPAAHQVAEHEGTLWIRDPNGGWVQRNMPMPSEALNGLLTAAHETD